MIITKANRILFCLLLIAAYTGRRGDAGPMVEFRARDATSLIVDDTDQPLARLRIGKIYSDYQTHWFFRIGVLPTVVCQDVRLDLIQTNILSESFAVITRHLRRASTRQGIEFRKFSCCLPGVDSPFLEAGRLRLDAEGHWRLSSGVSLRLDQTNRLFTEVMVSPLPNGEVQFSVTAPQAPFVRVLFQSTPRSREHVGKF
jgi:hypothetical protein